jgi:hypothetical protein
MTRSAMRSPAASSDPPGPPPPAPPAHGGGWRLEVGGWRLEDRGSGGGGGGGERRAPRVKPSCGSGAGAARRPGGGGMRGPTPRGPLAISAWACRTGQGQRGGPTPRPPTHPPWPACRPPPRAWRRPPLGPPWPPGARCRGRAAAGGAGVRWRSPPTGSRHHPGGPATAGWVGRPGRGGAACARRGARALQSMCARLGRPCGQAARGRPCVCCRHPGARLHHVCHGQHMQGM